jgi:CelD/BcsL family acetyltransferase involved in cellulose biosynthesis
MMTVLDRPTPDPTPVAVTVAPQGIRVECVDSTWGFTALRPHWNELLRTSAVNGPFLTWEWLHAWWQHLHASHTLQILVVRDGADLIAIAPLRRTPGALPGFSRLEFLGTGHAGSDYLDIIVRTGREADATQALAAYLNAGKSAIRLNHVPETSASALVAEQLAGGGWAMATDADGVCPILPIGGHTWDSFLATVGSAHRANVRRRLRAIEQNFTVRFALVTTEAERREALDALTGFHERRFSSEGGSTAFLTPDVRAFQDDATRRALDRGWLRMYVLHLNDTIAAVMYGFFFNRQFYFYQHGFDDQFARHSVGLVLMSLTVRAAIDEGAQTFDLLWGTEPYKWLWTRQTRPLRQIHLYPPHISGRIHRRAVDTRRRLGRLVRRVLSPGEDRAILA